MCQALFKELEKRLIAQSACPHSLYFNGWGGEEFLKIINRIISFCGKCYDENKTKV